MSPTLVAIHSSSSDRTRENRRKLEQQIRSQSPNRAAQVEVGTADGSGQLRPLPGELEPRGELRGDFHPFGGLEPTARFSGSSMVTISLIERPPF
jgi:hypothetical protein